MEDMIKARRAWVRTYKEQHGNKIPEDIKGYHDEVLR